MADLSKTVQIIFQGDDQASRKASDVIAKVNELERATKTASKSSDTLSESATGIGKAAPGINLLNQALSGLTAGLVVDKFIDANVQLERFSLGLKAVNGATADTNAEFAYIRDLSDRLGLSIDSLAGAYLKVTAASKGTTLEGQATRDVFEAVQRAMASLGQSTATTDRALQAVTQIVSKGKVQMEELRGQLGDALPGALQIAARALGTTTAGLEDMVKRGISAEEFLPKFAAELNRTFEGAQFNGYTANLNRLKNSVDDLFRTVGESGLFNLLTEVIQATSKEVASVSAELTGLGQVGQAAGRLLVGDIDGAIDLYERARLTFIGASAALEFDLNQSLAETNRLLRQSKEAASDSADQFDAETQRLLRQSSDATKAINEVDLLLKKLGVDPKKTVDGVEELAKALEALASNPRTNGEDFALAFASALKKATTEDAAIRLGEVLANAFNEGKISAEAYNASLKSLSDAFDKLGGSTKKAKEAADEQAKALKRQAEETRKAEQEAQRMRIELEKIASNERIKNIEAKVRLNVAEVEAQTKRVEAAFESINTTVNSTGDLLGDLFGLLKDFDNLSFGAIRLIEKQIETENARRDQALSQQKELVQAQINQLRAQTRAIDKGDSVIKIDGAGLQPHLEAFMFEILRQIQIRVNQDGLKLLLGV